MYNPFSAEYPHIHFLVETFSLRTPRKNACPRLFRLHHSSFKPNSLKFFITCPCGHQFIHVRDITSFNSHYATCLGKTDWVQASIVVLSSIAALKLSAAATFHSSWSCAPVANARKDRFRFWQFNCCKSGRHTTKGKENWTKHKSASTSVQKTRKGKIFDEKKASCSSQKVIAYSSNELPRLLAVYLNTRRAVFARRSMWGRWPTPHKQHPRQCHRHRNNRALTVFRWGVA